MISKAKLKQFSAYRQSKVCDQEHLFVVEGPKMCQEALQAGLPILAICATTDWLRLHPALPVEPYEVGEPELERLSSMKNPNQVWMLLSRQFAPLCEPSPHGLTLVLDRLQDPGNLGTILRTADWYGVRRIVCSHDSVSCFNPKVVQASMGALFRTHVEYQPLLPFLQQCQGPIYGAMLDGENLYASPIEAHDAFLVIGNESQGISPALRPLISRRLLIPNRGGTCESLNAAVATAILLSEFHRN